jgi:hydroxymethylglutaryl-CoA lyase
MIEVTDVTLRDGIQMEGRSVSVAAKLDLLDRLSACGYARLEVTSFVNPKWVPQFADADEFARALVGKKNLPELMAFIPNAKGFERMKAYPVIGWAGAFVATSEAFNKKNVNMSVGDSLRGLEATVKAVHAEKRRVRVYISTVFGCPYQGEISSAERAKVFRAVAAMNPDEIAVSDTIGVATPKLVRVVLQELEGVFPREKTALHLHNTYGMGLASVMAGYECGVRKFDGATGGIGGCPYAKGASGNVASDELLYAFFRSGEAKFPAPAVGRALDGLRELGMDLKSHLAEIRAKGGAWFGT